MKYSVAIVLAGVLLLSNASGLEIASSSFIGKTGDRVVATEIQPDGSIIVAANITGGPLASQSPPPGTVLRLSGDGSQMLAKTAVGGQVNDMSADADGNVFVASTAGVIKLDRQAKDVVWRKDLGRVANRIDAGRDGHCAVLCYDKPDEDTSTGAGLVFVFSPDGQPLGQFKGKHFTIGTFECAGGNHIFRWEPKLVDGKWASAREKKAKGDGHHAFYNSRAEHKTFMARYEPGTGEYLREQELCARLSSGRANAVRVKQGAIAATDDGSVLVAGTAAASLPVTLAPPNTGEYLGGSFVLKMQPELSQRDWCVRFQPGGSTHTVASRRIDDALVVVAGGSISEKSAEKFFTKNALQADGAPGCGFLTVLTEK